MDEVPRTN
ncbi:hypothetical protein TIFTF001_037577, partial [Ficus carica]